MWWWSVVALAEEPEPAVSEEITVLGQRVDAARDQVVSRIVDLGYDRVKDKDGKTVFRSPQSPWKGKVVLTDEGTLRVRRTGPRGKKMPTIPGTSIRPYPLCIVAPTACVSMGAWTVSDRRWAGIEASVANATAEDLEALSAAMADEALAGKLEVLPERLDGLWTDGESLFWGRPAVSTVEGRRAELLEFWDTRTETDWGRPVRDAVASFVRAVVEESPTPYTEGEKAAFEARRTSSVPFPWTAGDPEDADLP
ncbi:MAG: hypothetical protein H6738_04285 [Alphaproteobacteria bacterium]|nr:hypothetical protein [Alphaproteobacteria bacterium]MCB9695990.1 hypothetical protein [Alphaproteobacteria bacterium]